MLQHRGALQKVEAHHLKVKSTKASPKCEDFKAGGACVMPDGSRPDWHQLKATTDSDEQCQGLCEAKMEEDKSSSSCCLNGMLSWSLEGLQSGHPHCWYMTGGQATESGPTEHKSVTCTAAPTTQPPPAPKEAT